MISRTTRGLTAAERETLQGETTAARRPGCLSGFALYGAFLVLLPLMGGGFIGTVLRTSGIGDDVAYGTGIVACLIASSCFLIREARRSSRDSRRLREAAARVLARGEVERLAIGDVIRAWRVSDEVFGEVGLVLGTSGGEHIALLGEELDEMLDGDPVRLGGTWVLERLPATDRLIAASSAGDPIEVEGAGIPLNALRLEVDVHCELTCAILPPGFDPPASRDST